MAYSVESVRAGLTANHGIWGYAPWHAEPSNFGIAQGAIDVCCLILANPELQVLANDMSQVHSLLRKWTVEVLKLTPLFDRGSKLQEISAQSGIDLANDLAFQHQAARQSLSY